MKEVKTEISNEKEKWTSPQLYVLDVSKTQSGTPWEGSEGGSYHPLES